MQVIAALYFLTIFFAAIGLSLFTVYAWTRRNDPTGWLLFLIILSSGVVVFGRLGTLLSPNAEISHAFVVVQESLGSNPLPLYVFLLGVTFMDWDEWFTMRRLVPLSSITVVNALVILTDSYHGLLFTSYDSVPIGGFFFWERQFNWWYYVHMGYGYFFITIGVVFILLSMRNATATQQKQRWWIIAGSVAPTVIPSINILLSFAFVNKYMIRYINPYHLSFWFTGAFYAIAIFRYQMLDTRQVAYNIVFAEMPDAVIVIDPQERITEMNPAALALKDKRPAQVIGKPLGEVFPETMRGIQDSTLPFRSSDGRKLYFDSSSRELYQAGKSVGNLIILRDVTERVQAAQESYQFQQHLKTLHTVSVQLVQSPDVMAACKVTVDAALHQLGFERVGVFLIDNAAGTLNGTFGTDTDGKLRDERDYHDPLLQLHWIKTIANAPNRVYVWEDATLYDNSAVVGKGWHAGAAVWSNEQVIGYIAADNLISGRALRPYEGELLALLGTALGYVIANKHDEETLRQAMRAAESANHAKSRFLATMTHELRTPMNAVLGFTELIATAPNLTDHQREQISIISASGSHLLELINDILEISKIEAGEAVLNPRDYDLHAMLDAVRRTFAVNAQHKGITLSFDVDANVPTYVYGDETKLRQILVNLLSNAIKFTEAGSVSVNVAYAEAEPSSRLGITVSDTGPGIASDELDKLFSPFSQTESGIRKQQGTGLGLAIVHEYVKLMGGDIHIDSTVNKGTTIHFNAQVEPLTAPANTAAPHKIIVRGDQSHRVLLVDDNPYNLELMKTWLEPAGFAVRTASNGAEAVTIANAWQPHVIFMDLRMPEMDGYTASHQIHNMLPQTHIVALTASAFEDLPRLEASGINDYLRKPVTAAEVFQMLARLLDLPIQQTDFAAPVLTQQLTRAEMLPRLRTLPPNAIDKLRQHVMELDIEGTLSTARSIGEQDAALGNSLARYVQDLRFDTLFDLLDGL